MRSYSDATNFNGMYVHAYVHSDDPLSNVNEIYVCIIQGKKVWI